MVVNNLINALLRGTFLIDTRAVMQYMPRVKNLLEDKSLVMSEETEERFKKQIQEKRPKAYTPSSLNAHTLENAPKDSVAVIAINGPMMKEDWCGTPGTRTLGAWLKEADAHPNVNSIVLLIDSPGGSVDGTGEFADIIKSAQKPVVAFGDGLIASAAYWAASQTKHIMMSHDSAEIGSIGTAITITDWRGYDEAAGIKEHYITATASTDKNKMYMDARDGHYEGIKKELLDPTNDIFLKSVKASRPLNMVANNEPLTGKVYLSRKAIELGLADSIGTFGDAIVKASELSTQNFQNNSTMKLTIKKAWTALAAAFGVTFNQDETEKEVETSAEALADLNTKVTRLNDVEAENTTLKNKVGELTTAKDNAEQQLADMRTKYNEVVSENTNLKQTANPVVKPIKEGNDTQHSETIEESAEIREYRELQAFDFNTTKINDKPSWAKN